MIELLLSSKKTGRSRAIIHEVVPEAPADPEAILVQNMNQTSGPMSDPINSNHGSVVGGMERGLDGISAGSSVSAAGDGATGGVEIPNITQYQQRGDGSLINAFSVSFFAQRDTNPATEDRMIMAARAENVGESGRWSIEAHNDDGIVRLRAHIGGTWIGSINGITALTSETAYRIVMTYDGTDGKLWVNDGPAVATETIADGGASNNTSGIYLYGYHNGLKPFDGIIDDFVMWDGALDQTAIEALDDAVTIEHGDDPPPVEEFSCLERSTPAGINTDHKDIGNFTSSQFLNGATNNTKYDGTGSTFIVTWNGSSWSNQFGWRLGRAHDGACMSGGSHRSNITIDERWGLIYKSGHGGQLFIRDQNCHNMLFEGFRFHGSWDAIRHGFKSGVSISNITHRGHWISLNRDDACENDRMYDGIVYDDMLIDGTYSGFSSTNSSPDGSAHVTVVTNVLIRLRAMHGQSQGVYDHGQFFKLNSKSPMWEVHDSIFYVENDVIGGSGAFRSMLQNNKLLDATNNKVLWGASGSFPGDIPDGFTLTHTGQGSARSEWEIQRSAWLTAHPLVERLGSPYDNLVWD